MTNHPVLGVLAVEGTPIDDGQVLLKGALSLDETVAAPITVDDANVGAVTGIERQGNGHVTWSGHVWDEGVVEDLLSGPPVPVALVVDGTGRELDKCHLINRARVRGIALYVNGAIREATIELDGEDR